MNMTIIKFCILILYSSNLFAWGQIGHRVVGEIAESHLSSKANKEIRKILGNESLAQASTWPDFIRRRVKELDKFTTWHYINIKKGYKLSEIKRSDKGDVLTALYYFEKELKNKKLSKKKKIEALRFLVHFTGDVHQPLHAGYLEDKGGNSIKLTWFGEMTNLHSIWDRGIISAQKLSYKEYTKFINNPSASDIKAWQKSSKDDWVIESSKLVPRCYNYGDKKRWEYDYIYANLAIVNIRLLQAGVRLAGVLNKIYQ